MRAAGRNSRVAFGSPLYFDREQSMSHDHPLSESLTRRRFLAASAGTALLLPRLTETSAVGAEAPAGPHQATGTRVGEVTENSAIVWTRLTRNPVRNMDGVVIPGKVIDRQNFQPTTVPRDEIEGS